jgi:hypothetical protein
MNIADHISESLETIFWAEILKFFDADADPDPGSGNIFDPGSGTEKFGFGINIPDPQHCTSGYFSPRAQAKMRLLSKLDLDPSTESSERSRLTKLHKC